MKKYALNAVAKAINALDESCFNKCDLSKENRCRWDISRKNLINILFSEGYELNYLTRRLVKSTEEREML